MYFPDRGHVCTLYVYATGLTSYFLPVLLFSVHSCFYSKCFRHWMAFYVLMCR